MRSKIPVPVLSNFLFYFYFFTLRERSKEVRTLGEIVSRIIRHNLITQMFYGLNFIIVFGGRGRHQFLLVSADVRAWLVSHWLMFNDSKT